MRGAARSASPHSDNHQADRLSRIIEKKMTLEQAMDMNEHSGAEVIDLSDNVSRGSK